MSLLLGSKLWWPARERHGRMSKVQIPCEKSTISQSDLFEGYERMHLMIPKHALSTLLRSCPISDRGLSTQRSSILDKRRKILIHLLCNSPQSKVLPPINLLDLAPDSGHAACQNRQVPLAHKHLIVVPRLVRVNVDDRIQKRDENLCIWSRAQVRDQE